MNWHEVVQIDGTTVRSDFEENINLNGLEFIPIASGSSWLGSDKGGWIYASQRPRYEVRLPSFYILQKPLTRGQVALLLDEEMRFGTADEPMTGLRSTKLKLFKKNRNWPRFDRKNNHWMLECLRFLRMESCLFEH